jgi:hypothetical protein
MADAPPEPEYRVLVDWSALRASIRPEPSPELMDRWLRRYGLGPDAERGPSWWVGPWAAVRVVGKAAAMKVEPAGE